MEERTKTSAERKQKFLKASMTVEASYIMPIILGIIFAVMAVCFYFYDVTASQAVLDRNTVKLKNIFIHPFEEKYYYYDYSLVNKRFLYSFSKDCSEQEQMGAEQIKKELKASLMILTIQNIDVQIKNKKITATAELHNILPFYRKTKNIQSCRSVYHPADFARLLARIDKAAEQ